MAIPHNALTCDRVDVAFVERRIRLKRASQKDPKVLSGQIVEITQKSGQFCCKNCCTEANSRVSGQIVEITKKKWADTVVKFLILKIANFKRTRNLRDVRLTIDCQNAETL